MRYFHVFCNQRPLRGVCESGMIEIDEDLLPADLIGVAREIAWFAPVDLHARAALQALEGRVSCCTVGLSLRGR